MKTLKYELNSDLHIEYDIVPHSKELDRLCDVRLSTNDMMLSVMDDYIPDTEVAERIFIDKDIEATASVYNLKENYVRMSLAGNMGSPLFLDIKAIASVYNLKENDLRMSLAGNMGSPLFLATLIHELSHAKQALDGFWQGLLCDYNDVRSGQYILGPKKLVAIGQVLPEVKNVFNENVQMHAYFDAHDAIVTEFEKLSYPHKPLPTLWTYLTGGYRQELADYKVSKMEFDRCKRELRERRSSLKPTYNQVMCDRLPSLLVEFDANQRTFEYLKDLRTRGFALPENCIDSGTGEYVALEKRLEYALGYWVVGDFEYPKDFAGVARLCN